MKEYIAAELEPVTAYPDQEGNLHLSREEAMEANFNGDLESLVEKVCHEEGGTSWVDGDYVIAVLKNIARNHPDYLRILLGDRSMT